MMRRSLLALTIVLLVAGPAAANSLDDILTKALDARGGVKSLKKVESARIAGNFAVVGMMEAPFTMEWKRPNKLRISFTTPQGDGIQAFDGEKAWAMMPGVGVMEISGDQADSLRRQSDLIDGPLVDWKGKGHTVEYLGEGDLEGVAVQKLALSQAGGTELTVFLDAGNFLVIRQSGTTKVQGAETEIDTFISDYKEVDGLMMAHKIKSEMIDLGMTQELSMSSIEFNVDLPDNLFAMPEIKAAESEQGEEEPAAE